MLRRLVLALVLVAVAAPAAMAQDVGPLATLLNRTANPDGPFAKRHTAADSVVARAREQVGKRYKFASASPDAGFDCSGLVRYVLGTLGRDLPHNAARMASAGSPVPADTSALRPGDLLLFGSGRSTRISHVGIYVGNGRMIHASTSQRRVIETPLPAGGAALRLRSARRVLVETVTARGGAE